MRQTPTFHPDGHVYTMGRRALPHVTGVLKATGVVDTQWYRQIHADRGSAVHTATVLWEQHRLDQNSVDPRIRGYLNAYQRFCLQHQPVWEQTEHLVYSALYNYAGRLDRAGGMQSDQAGSRPWVIDIKTGPPMRAVRLQLVAYAQALREETARVYRRGALLLRNDGSYHLKPYDLEAHTYREDLNAFLGGLALLRWMGREGDAT